MNFILTQDNIFKLNIANQSYMVGNLITIIATYLRSDGVLLDISNQVVIEYVESNKKYVPNGTILEHQINTFTCTYIDAGNRQWQDTIQVSANDNNSHGVDEIVNAIYRYLPQFYTKNPDSRVYAFINAVGMGISELVKDIHDGRAIQNYKYSTPELMNLFQLVNIYNTYSFINPQVHRMFRYYMQLSTDLRNTLPFTLTKMARFLYDCTSQSLRIGIIKPEIFNKSFQVYSGTSSNMYIYDGAPSAIANNVIIDPVTNTYLQEIQGGVAGGNATLGKDTFAIDNSPITYQNTILVEVPPQITSRQTSEAYYRLVQSVFYGLYRFNNKGFNFNFQFLPANSQTWQLFSINGIAHTLSPAIVTDGIYALSYSNDEVFCNIYKSSTSGGDTVITNLTFAYTNQRQYDINNIIIDYTIHAYTAGGTLFPRPQTSYIINVTNSNGFNTFFNGNSLITNARTGTSLNFDIIYVYDDLSNVANPVKLSTTIKIN